MYQSTHKYFRGAVLLWAVLAFLPACRKSFVDLTSPTAINAAGFYNTQSGLSSAVVGAYGELRAYYDLYWSMTEMPSDNTVIDASSLAAFGEFKLLTWSPSDGQGQSKW